MSPVIVKAAAAALAAFNSLSNSNLAVYYGQGPAQPRLAHFCADTNLDIIPIGFVNVFPDQAGGGYPGTNFGDQCGNATYTNKDGSPSPLLSDCPLLGEDIKTCQLMGKKILLSLGGASPTNQEIKDKSHAESFATQLWEIFGPEDETTGAPRPFGDAAVDGFDFDIESLIVPAPDSSYQYRGYADMINKLRSLYKSDQQTTRYISGAPQCIVPDAHLADAIENSWFDFLFVQFYNTAQCSARAFFDHTYGAYGGPPTDISFDAWVNFVQTKSQNKAAKVYLGLPASTVVVYDAPMYLQPKEAEEIIKYYKCKYPEQFGGVMVYEATDSENNSINGTSYADLMKQYLEECDCSNVTLPPISTTNSSVTSTTSALSSTSASSTTSASSSTSASSTTSTLSTSSASSSSSISSGLSTSTVSSGTGTSTSTSAGSTFMNSQTSTFSNSTVSSSKISSDSASASSSIDNAKLTTSSTVSTSKGSSTTTTAVTPATTLDCQPDNCLRAFLGVTRTPGLYESAQAFCTGYNAGSAVPTPAFAAQCSGLPSRVSSACSCFLTPATATSYGNRTVTSTISSGSSTPNTESTSTVTLTSTTSSSSSTSTLTSATSTAISSTSASTSASISASDTKSATITAGPKSASTSSASQTTQEVVTTVIVYETTTECPVTNTVTSGTHTMTQTTSTISTVTVTSVSTICTNCAIPPTSISSQAAPKSTAAPSTQEVITTEIIYETTTVCPVTATITSGAHVTTQTSSTISTVTITTISTICTNCVAPTTTPMPSSSLPAAPQSTHEILTTDIVYETTTICPVTATVTSSGMPIVQTTTSVSTITLTSISTICTHCVAPTPSSSKAAPSTEAPSSTPAAPQQQSSTPAALSQGSSSSSAAAQQQSSSQAASASAPTSSQAATQQQSSSITASSQAPSSTPAAPLQQSSSPAASSKVTITSTQTMGILTMTIVPVPISQSSQAAQQASTAIVVPVPVSEVKHEMSSTTIVPAPASQSQAAAQQMSSANSAASAPVSQSQAAAQQISSSAAAAVSAPAGQSQAAAQPMSSSAAAAASAPASQSNAAAQQMSSVPVAPYVSSKVTVPAATGSQAKATGTSSFPPTVSTFQGAASKIGGGMGLVVALGAGWLLLLLL